MRSMRKLDASGRSADVILAITTLLETRIRQTLDEHMRLVSKGSHDLSAPLDVRAVLLAEQVLRLCIMQPVAMSESE
jgi:hypothetical protein